MKFIFCTLTALTLCCCGCKSKPETTTIPTGDNKPVAPESYSDSKADSSDPVLPKMTPWWKLY